MRRHAGPAAVVAGYVALALWVTGVWWVPLGARLTGVNQRDAMLFAWLLTWTPHALGDGRPPLLATGVNAPDGINLMWNNGMALPALVNLMWNNGMALPALVFAPVTAAWGGLATITVLTAVGLAGSAVAAFGPLRALGATTLPAALGGARRSRTMCCGGGRPRWCWARRRTRAQAGQVTALVGREPEAVGGVLLRRDLAR